MQLGMGLGMSFLTISLFVTPGNRMRVGVRVGIRKEIRDRIRNGFRNMKIKEDWGGVRKRVIAPKREERARGDGEREVYIYL
jgi:hypothetical protein